MKITRSEYLAWMGLMKEISADPKLAITSADMLEMLRQAVNLDALLSQEPTFSAEAVSLDDFLEFCQRSADMMTLRALGRSTKRSEASEFDDREIYWREMAIRSWLDSASRAPEQDEYDLDDIFDNLAEFCRTTAGVQ